MGRTRGTSQVQVGPQGASPGKVALAPGRGPRTRMPGPPVRWHRFLVEAQHTHEVASTIAPGRSPTTRMSSPPVRWHGRQAEARCPHQTSQPPPSPIEPSAPRAALPRHCPTGVLNGFPRRNSILGGQHAAAGRLVCGRGLGCPLQHSRPD
jgi:hypothetical protein